MEIRSIHLGGMFHAEEEIQMTSTMANFVGQLQGFVYNGNRYIVLTPKHFSNFNSNEKTLTLIFQIY